MTDDYRCPDCPECGNELIPAELADTRMYCLECDYEYDWVEAYNAVWSDCNE